MSTPDGWTVSASVVPPLTLADPVPPTIIIQGADRQPLVTINPNGTLDYGPEYQPDEAARAFWDAIRRYAGARCPKCGHVPAEQEGGPA